MGDRVLVGFRSNERESPIVYLHWGGHCVEKLLRETFEQMRGRLDDLEYVTARFVGKCHESIGIAENTGLGVWNLDGRLSQEESHGDAGVFEVDIFEDRWEIKARDGYGFGPTGEEDDEEPDYDLGPRVWTHP